MTKDNYISCFCSWKIDFSSHYFQPNVIAKPHCTMCGLFLMFIIFSTCWYGLELLKQKKEYPLRHARCGWHKFSKAFFLLITVKNRLLKLLLEIRANLKHLTDPKLGPVAQEQLDTLVRGLKWHHFCRCHSTTDVSYILWSFFMIWPNKAKDMWASKRSKSGRPSMYFIPIFLLHNTSILQAIYFHFYQCKKNPHCLLFPVFVLG